MLRRLRYVMRTGVFCLLVGLPSLASTHEQKTAVTRIFFNPATSNIEVMHRFLVHDAEHAAQQIFESGISLLESSDSRELFSSYVVNRFSLDAGFSGGKEAPLELIYVGTEIDGQFIWVYQETPIPQNIDSVTVVNLALRDVWPDQSNLVNLERGGEITSAVFEQGVDVKRLAL